MKGLGLGIGLRRFSLRRTIVVPFLTLILQPQGLLGQTGGRELSLDDLLNLTVSSASKYAQKSSEAPANITIITAEEIRRYGFQNLAEAVATLTSFSNSTDHTYTYTGVRGFARPADYNNRVLVLLDGTTHNENVLGAGEIGGLRYVDIEDVERVEVVRGPGSSLYGARAMFAVVNVITKDGAELEGARAWGDIGSFGHRQAGAQYGRLYGNGLDIVVAGGWEEMDGQDFFFPEFETPETNFGIAEGRNWGELLRGRVKASRGGLRFWGAAYDRRRGTPAPGHGSVFNDPEAETEDKAWTVDLKYDKAFSAQLALTVRTYVRYFSSHHVYPHPGNRIDINLGATWSGSEARIRWDLGPDHRLVAGTEFQWTPTAEWEMEDDVGEAEFSGDYPYSIGSIFLQDEYQVTGNLAITAGVRYDRYSSERDATTPRAALVYHPWEKSTLKVLWGNAFRAPNIYEENFESPYASHLASVGLESEEIHSTEVVWEQRLATGLAGKIGVFRNDVANLIDQKPVARPDAWPPSSTGLPYALQFGNGEKIRAEGAEAEVTAAFESGFLGFIRYAAQRAEVFTSGEEAPNYPKHSVKVGATHKIAGLGSLGSTLLWESSRLTLAGPETEGYSILDATLSTDPILGHLNLTLYAKNLLNTRYSLPGGPQHSLISIPQSGRRFVLRVGVEW